MNIQQAQEDYLEEASHLDDEVYIKYMAHIESGLALMDSIKETYPIGMKVFAQIGRGKIEIEITGHGTKIEDPMLIIGENVVGGAVRKFYPKNIKAIMSKPGE